jgi:hypothetical protein
MEELQQAYTELESWSSPPDFQRQVDALNAKVGNHFYFTRPFKSLREAWVLAEFARLISAENVRLNTVQDSEADGYIKISGECHKVQITGADKPGRKICDEYKPGPNHKVLTSEPIKDADDVANALASAIERKVKRYGSVSSEHAARPMLVIDLNFGVHGRPDEETKLRSRIAALKDKYAQHFDGIYILQSGKLD